MDWGVAEYEHIARHLEPAAAVVLDALCPVSGKPLLDVACGNGNLALLAARAGATVTGFDQARRLLDAARDRLAAEGLEAEWVAGDAQRLPFDEDSFAATASVFGVIFVPDAERAAAEMRRVTRPGGSIALTAWQPRGGIAEAMKLAREATAEDVEQTPADAPALFDWSDAAVLGELLGDGVEITEQLVAFRADSARAWVEAQRDHHPLWVEMEKAIPPERFEKLAEEMIAVLESHNEETGSFLINSPYILAKAHAA